MEKYYVQAYDRKNDDVLTWDVGTNFDHALFARQDVVRKYGNALLMNGYGEMLVDTESKY